MQKIINFIKNLFMKLRRKKKDFKFTINIVKPHSKVSRNVLPADFDKVFNDAKEMMVASQRIATNTRTEVFALSHPQVRDKDPLRFFVLNPFDQHIQGLLKQQGHNHTIYINPVIIDHTKVPVDSEEGCVTFLDKKNVTVQRYHKITVRYETFEPTRDEKGVVIEGKPKHVIVEREAASGLFARIFQHEIGHFNAEYVHKPEEKK